MEEGDPCLSHSPQRPQREGGRQERWQGQGLMLSLLFRGPFRRGRHCVQLSPLGNAVLLESQKGPLGVLCPQTGEGEEAAWSPAHWFHSNSHTLGCFH